MPYFPFYIDIKNKPCLVVGGGSVALRKIRKLLPFEPKIKVVAPKISSEILKLGSVECVEREFENSDTDGAFFVISATDDEAVNAAIFRLCKEKNILVNTVDDKEKCSFIFPALACQGDITVGISTGGKSPLFARFLRENIEEMLSGRYMEIAELLGTYREKIKGEFSSESKRKKAFEALLDMCFAEDKIPDAQQIDFMLKEMKDSYEDQNRDP